MMQSHTKIFDDVRAAERERIDAQRKLRGVHEDQPIVGLALSGGGMRSSFFSLGVLQALEKQHLLARIDYLSTVSGGGYIGAALTWFRRNGEKRFPFGGRGQGVRLSESEPGQILGFLRQHGEYLTPAGGADSRAEGGTERNFGAEARTSVPPIAYLGGVMRSVFLSTFVYGSMLVGVFFVLDVLDRVVTLAAPILAALYPTPTWITVVANLNFALLVGVALLTLLGLAWISYPIGAYVMGRWRRRRSADEQESNRTYLVGLWAQRWTGRALGATLIATAFGSVPVAAGWAGHWLPDRWALGMASLTSIGIGAILGVSVFRQDRRLLSRWTATVAMLDRVRAVSAAVLMLYGLLVLAHVIAVGVTYSGVLVASLVVLIVGMVSGLFADVNQMSITRMYRDRLMEAFLPGNFAVSRNQWQPAFQANVGRLAAMSAAETLGPYPLINTNLITVGSRRTRYRSRGGDSFILSPLYSGSDGTGWRQTRDWLEGKLTLATAMAISGHTERHSVGARSRGPSRNRLASAAMFVLGLRLGFWASNPKREGPPPPSPNYRDPGLLRGILGLGRHEGGRYIELSDGGEFDDLGVYELIRRRADVIISVDATEDAHCAFDGLANAVARVRIDFGVDVEFSDPAFDLDALVPPAGGDAEREYAKRGFAVGTIRYADANGALEKWGVLLYLKATMLSGLPPDVRGYRGVHGAFPHEVTSERSFNEDRVEAYRELGYYIAKDLVLENERRRKEGARVRPANGSDPGPWL